MKELEDRIIADGQVIGNNILKVDAFLNHQIDPEFILRIGAELARRFKDEGVNKVLTVEASGIAVAMAAALALKQGRPQMAERILRTAQASRSADAGVLRILARTLGDLQQYTEAINISQRVIAQNPAEVSDYLDRAGWLLQMNRPKEAVTEVGFALRIDPSDMLARAWLQKLIADETQR